MKRFILRQRQRACAFESRRPKRSRSRLLDNICSYGPSPWILSVLLVTSASVSAQLNDPGKSVVSAPQDASAALTGLKPQRLFVKEALQAAAPETATPVRVPEPPPSEDVPVPKTDLRNHLLAPNDLISVKVYQEPDLDFISRIDKEGTVNYPLLGPVKVAGKTSQQANNLIRGLLAKDYLVNPQVNLTIIEYAKKEFTIMGEGVQRPGTYPLPEDKPLALQQAVALAGGFKPGAKVSKVKVTRIVGDEKTITQVDASAFSKDKRAKPFVILPDDHIEIDTTFF